MIKKSSGGKIEKGNQTQVAACVKGLGKGRYLGLNADINVRVRGQEDAKAVRNGWQEDSWLWMQTDRQGNQRQAVTFSVAGGSKALFKGLVNAGCC